MHVPTARCTSCLRVYPPSVPSARALPPLPSGKLAPPWYVSLPHCTRRFRLSGSRPLCTGQAALLLNSHFVILLRSPSVLRHYCTTVPSVLPEVVVGEVGLFFCAHTITALYFNLSFKYGNHNCIPFVFFAFSLGAKVSRL